MITELVQRVYTDRVLSHLAHWATQSYAQHIALESFYSDVIDPLDDLVEDYQAAFGLIDKVTFNKFETETDCLGCLKDTVKWINKHRSDFGTQHDIWGHMPLIRAADIVAGTAKMPQTGFACDDCREPIHESLTGCRRLGDGSFVCSDCYFKLFEALENTPIMSPRLRRRG